MNARRHAVTLAAFLLGALPVAAQNRPPAPASRAAALFRPADGCMACHNGMAAPDGEDVSMGLAWRPSMMANSARDPYWQAGVRREGMDHPQAVAEIENDCSPCHMPMSATGETAAGGPRAIFAHLPVGARQTPEALLAADGVSCTACHQIRPEKLGTRESFTGGFVIDTSVPYGNRQVFGPFDVAPGVAHVMQSAAEFKPATAAHLQTPEMCATCHTLFTHALGPDGKAAGELPEQVPYLEWRHSAYRGRQTCQACHMPVVSGAVPIASLLGAPREGFSRHEFRGANFYMPRVLNRYGTYLSPAALPQELEAASRRDTEYLQAEAARLELTETGVSAGRLTAALVVTNLGGHKLPTAYPSRRAWLHVTVRDRTGRSIFESGAFEPSGAIRGNDNDADGARFEPHHAEIASADQVQIYEPIMGDAAGRVTTGLLTGVRYLKDNRLLPRGFDKGTAPADIAVQGGAGTDPDFVGGSDTVRYVADVSSAEGPFTVQAELWYQPIAFRWAQNLKAYNAPEPARFVKMYDDTAAGSAVVLARTSRTVSQ